MNLQARGSFGRAVATVLAKELRDAVRDRRTLVRLLLPTLLMGPLLLLALSALVAALEERAERREIVAVGLEHAPTLRNFLERQTYTIKAAPPDYPEQLRSGRLLEPVLVVSAGFEEALAQLDSPVVEVVSDSSHDKARGGVARVLRLLQAFNSERGLVHLALRGVSPQVLQSVDVQERDLASLQSRSARLTAMIPLFIIMAVLYGALTAALDSTAGERERGSLEPLLFNPVSPLALALGKWLAVALLGMAVAVLGNLGFVPAQWWVADDHLRALFQFGWTEVALFSALQVPLAASFGALLMAVAIRSRSFKEAQASSGVLVTLVGLAPMVSLLNPEGDADWYLWVPGLAQSTLMGKVLKGDELGLLQLAPGVVVSLALTAVCLGYVAHAMRAAVAR